MNEPTTSVDPASVLGALDLNLLLVLDSLLRERSVTRAARRLGRSQPAMSHALARLRVALGDPLLVRGGRTFALTARAEALAAPLASALGELASALAPPEPFDPLRVRRELTMATVDYVDIVLVPPLLAALGRRAPGVDLRVRPLQSDAADALADPAVDLIVGAERSGRLGRAAKRRVLFDEEFACVVRADHPRVGRRLTLDVFCELSHLLIAPGGRRGGVVDDALLAMGRAPRRVALMLPTFAAAPSIVKESDLLLTLPRRIALGLATNLGLRVLAPPIQLPGFRVAAFWHPRWQRDPAHAFFREVLVQVARSA